MAWMSKQPAATFSSKITDCSARANSAAVSYSRTTPRPEWQTCAKKVEKWRLGERVCGEEEGENEEAEAAAASEEGEAWREGSGAESNGVGGGAAAVAATAEEDEEEEEEDEEEEEEVVNDEAEYDAASIAIDLTTATGSRTVRTAGGLPCMYDGGLDSTQSTADRLE